MHPGCGPWAAGRGPGGNVSGTGLRTHRHHQPHGSPAPGQLERHETSDPGRSSAVESRFQCVRQAPGRCQAGIRAPSPVQTRLSQNRRASSSSVCSRTSAGSGLPPEPPEAPPSPEAPAASAGPNSTASTSPAINALCSVSAAASSASRADQRSAIRSVTSRPSLLRASGGGLEIKKEGDRLSFTSGNVRGEFDLKQGRLTRYALSNLAPVIMSVP